MGLDEGRMRGTAKTARMSANDTESEGGKTDQLDQRGIKAKGGKIYKKPLQRDDRKRKTKV